jgi:hypothetical protein
MSARRLSLFAVALALSLLPLAARAQTPPATTPAEDSSVTLWVETHLVAKDRSRPVAADNPEDPQRSYTCTIFALASHDGLLVFTEFPKRDDGNTAQIEFRHASKAEKDAFHVFPPMMRVIIDDKDATRRAIAMSTVCRLYHNQNPRLFNRLALDPDVLKTVTASYSELRDSLLLVDADVAAGKVEPAEYKKVLAALNACRALDTFDFKANPKALDAARKVVDVGIPYAKIVQDRKLKLINQFADAVVPLLSDTQKQTAVKIGEEVLTTYWNMQAASAARRVLTP